MVIDGPDLFVASSVHVYGNAADSSVTELPV
jgi:hypothetical protein